jgi:hypothetical protein
MTINVNQISTYKIIPVGVSFSTLGCDTHRDASIKLINLYNAKAMGKIKPLAPKWYIETINKIRNQKVGK